MNFAFLESDQFHVVDESSDCFAPVVHMCIDKYSLVDKVAPSAALSAATTATKPAALIAPFLRTSSSSSSTTTTAATSTSSSSSTTTATTSTARGTVRVSDGWLDVCGVHALLDTNAAASIASELDALFAFVRGASDVVFVSSMFFEKKCYDFLLSLFLTL